MHDQLTQAQSWFCADAMIMGIVSARPIVLGSAPGVASRRGTAAGAPIAYCGAPLTLPHEGNGALGI